MKVVFFGTSPFGLPILEALLQSRHELAAVVTTPDRPQGRRLQVQSSPVKRWAAERGLETLDYEPALRAGVRSRLASLSPDLAVVASFGYLIGPEFLSLPALLTINVHPSLLPLYRGASPIQRALLDGSERTGVTLIRMNEALDEGDILCQETAPIDPADTALTLEPRLARLAAGMLIRAVEAAGSGTLSFTPQDSRAATYAPKIRKEDGRVDWTRPAAAIVNQVRALAEWPGTYCRLHGQRLLLHEARASAGTAGAEPGQVLRSDARAGVIEIACGEGALSVLRLQLEGRKALTAREFLSGYPLAAGARLE